ncbi:MAG TPA: polysaccharide deacetylase family protein [Phycicoccus sp.]|jgi:peptidoglycan/xylan/chitin deacetylase (PgdA/CDA1 family)|nr:polysaccharide deacetylase family protein [Phycicoccus sp.]HQH06213.1 polysaccharide deacetylase family protein [Phycicoccus sp.]HQK30270.1 polysaccharide deacetylase family protein [Phycicoccus sp.]HQV90569.1 polysaccharide deacetylase family protein [Phycicoccus sp.]HQY95641.1 polysaccharide deacetylase family protein [Phycicoccus sp.]
MSAKAFYGSAVLIAAVLAAVTHGTASSATSPQQPTSHDSPTSLTAHASASPTTSPSTTSPSASATVPDRTERMPTPSGAATATDNPSSPPTPAPSTHTAQTAPTGAPATPAPTIPIAPEGGVIHLTFDDGPEPTWTPQVLALLAEFDARATFFVIGRQASAHPDLIAKERAAGHVVGNHTWSHPNLTQLSTADATRQITDTQRTLGSATCVRPPYGAVNTAVNATAANLGLRVTLWDIDTRDWEKPGAAVIAERAISQAHNGAVILMHDGGSERSQTLAAARTVLSTLKAKGWRFEPIPGC